MKQLPIPRTEVIYLVEHFQSDFSLMPNALSLKPMPLTLNWLAPDA